MPRSQEIFAWIAALGGALLAVGYVIRRIWAAVIVLPTIADALVVLVDADHPIGDRLAQIEEQLILIDDQLKPNGGRTIRDRVDAVEQKVDDILHQQEMLLLSTRRRGDDDE